MSLLRCIFRCQFRLYHLLDVGSGSAHIVLVRADSSDIYLVLYASTLDGSIFWSNRDIVVIILVCNMLFTTPMDMVCLTLLAISNSAPFISLCIKFPVILLQNPDFHSPFQYVRHIGFCIEHVLEGCLTI